MVCRWQESFLELDESALQRAAYGRLADEQAACRPRYAPLQHQRVKHQQQIEVETPEITLNDSHHEDKRFE